MSAINETQSRSIYTPLIHYKLKDLKDETKANKVIEYFQCSPPDMEEILELLDEVAVEKNTLVLDRLIENQIIERSDIEHFIHQCDWLPEYYISALGKAIQGGKVKEKTALFLIDMPNLLSKAIKLFPDRLTKSILEKLIQRNKISAAQVSLLAKSSAPFTALLEIFETTLFDTPKRIDPFKGTPVLKACIDSSIKKKETKILRKLIEERLLKPSTLKNSLSENLDLQVGYQQELAKVCLQPEANQAFIYFLLDAGVQYDKQDLYNVAKFGNFQILDKFIVAGAEISETLFLLLKQEKEIPLIALIKGASSDKLNPNLKNLLGNTLLIEAVANDKPNIVKALLEYGANPLILDTQGQSVFDIAKDKSPQTRTLLYDYKHIQHASSGTSCNSNRSIEEETLLKFLNTKSKGVPFSNFYCLIMKTQNIAIALLKRDSFSEKMDKSESASLAYHPRNLIHAWVSPTPFPIPNEFMPNQTTIDTLAFAILPSTSSHNEDEVVKIGKKHYTCLWITSAYKTNNPSNEYGFKYSYEGLSTHGHGKNPEAARSAFREHRDGINLSHWIPIPDLTEETQTIDSHIRELNQKLQETQESHKKLQELRKQICSFIDQSSSTIELRYEAAKSPFDQDSRSIERTYTALKRDLQNAHSYVLTAQKLSEWQKILHKYIETFQSIEERLVNAKPIDTSSFETENQVLENHLKGIKELIVDRSVTSSEVATLKVYTTSPLVKDVFNPQADSIAAIKMAICQLIGASLVNIPAQINTNLAAKFFCKSFRLDMQNQLNAEAQFIVKSKPLIHPRSMHVLASNLAFMDNASKILDIIPPFPPPEKDYTDGVLHDIMATQLLSYATSRKVLDSFWLEVCSDKKFVEEHLDAILELLIQRLLLIDEEIRESNEDYVHYPLFEFRHPKRMLDEQLFLLQTSFLIAIRNQTGENSPTLFIDGTLKLIQLRFLTNFYGHNKQKAKPLKLFVIDVLGVLRKVKEIIEIAWDADDRGHSPFQCLYDLLADYELPKKEVLERELIATFRALSVDAPLLSFDGSMEKLITKTAQIRKEIEKLKKAYGAENNDSSLLLKGLKDAIDKALKFFKVIDLNKKTPKVDLKETTEVYERASKEDLIKIIKVLSDHEKTDNVTKNLEEINHLIKKLPDLAQIKPGNAKKLQKECATCKKSILDYINEHENSSIDFSTAKKELKQRLDVILSQSKGLLEANINILPTMVKKLENPDYSGSEMVIEMSTFLEQLSVFFKGKKGKNHVETFKKPIGDLSTALSPLKPLAMCLQLKGLLKPLEDFQKALYINHIGRLSQMSKQLSLGIRQETYYTIKNENVTNYCWDGESFDSNPYHSDNEVHIPLVHDKNRASLQAYSWHKSLSEDHPDRALYINIWQAIELSLKATSQKTRVSVHNGPNAYPFLKETNQKRYESFQSEIKTLEQSISKLTNSEESEATKKAVNAFKEKIGSSQLDESQKREFMNKINSLLGTFPGTS